MRLLTTVFGSQRRVHPPIRSGGVLSIIITANSSFRQCLFKHIHEPLTGIRRVKKATTQSLQGNRGISRRNVPITSYYLDVKETFPATYQSSHTTMGRHQKGSEWKCPLLAKYAKQATQFPVRRTAIFVAAHSLTRCTSTIQHRTALSTAPSSSHCDFTRCRRRPRSQRGRQLRAVVTLSLYRRTRNSGDVKNGSKGAEGEAPFPLSAATVRTQPLVTSRNDAP